MPNSVETVFVVLSDLHFGPDLPESARIQNLNVPITYGRGSDKVTKRFETFCVGHHKPCVAALGPYLKWQLLKLKNHGGYRNAQFDLFVLLGDQSTLAHEQSYKFLREYLLKDEYVTTDEYITYRCPGLEIPEASIMSIPGNHDKLLRKNLDLYHNEFSKKLNLSEQVKPQESVVTVRRFAGREFIFILLEPSVYCSEELTLDGSIVGHAAKGMVNEPVRQHIRKELKVLQSGGKLESGCYLENPYANAMKVMLVHYAVDLTRFSWEWFPHDCAGLQDFVEKLREEFQLSLVLHGHLHQPLIYNSNGVQVVAATTATRVDQGKKTGFFFLKVFESGEMQTEHHVWNGAAYALDPDLSLKRPVGYVPRPVIAVKNKPPAA